MSEGRPHEAASHTDALNHITVSILQFQQANQARYDSLLA